jgi:hypothetical protein
MDAAGPCLRMVNPRNLHRQMRFFQTWIGRAARQGFVLDKKHLKQKIQMNTQPVHTLRQ